MPAVLYQLARLLCPVVVALTATLCGLYHVTLKTQQLQDQSPAVPVFSLLLLRDDPLV
jgi:hypothetical protein